MIPESLLSHEIDYWIDCLKPYQQEPLRVYLENLSPEGAAKKWLSTSGPDCIVAFGGKGDATPFWDRFQEELTNFFCNDSAYVDEKAQMNNHKQVTGALAISIISAALASTLGLAASLLAPAVAMMLFTICKIGVKAYCSTS